MHVIAICRQAMAETPASCIVVLMGLPGAGKTDFCRKFSAKNASCVHVCYDQLISLERQKEMTSQPGEWKQEREKIVEAVEMLVTESTESGHSDNPYFTTLHRSWGPKASRKIILIDDNNYLQSMRYDYYQLARKCTLGFAQLYVSCSPAVARKNNKLRKLEDQVPDEVIVNMADKLEAPSPFTNKWEAFSFTLEAPGSSDLEMVEAVIEAAASNPVQEAAAGVSAEERDHDRVVCSASLAHQADNMLRSLVNKRMLGLKQSGLGKQEMNLASKKVYSAKTELLEDLKTGFTKLDKDLVNSVQERQPEGVIRLEEHLATLFEQKVDLSN